MFTADMARDMSGDGKVMEALERCERGFEVRMHVSYSGGIRQTPAFYAFW